MHSQLLDLAAKSTGFNLESVANTTTKTMVALLSIAAVVLVGFGLIRAWAGRRRVQVVIEDVTVPSGLPASAASGLSPLLRQAVRNALRNRPDDASHSVRETLEKDIAAGWLRARGNLRVKTITSGLSSTIDDSMKLLAAGIGAVAPKEAGSLVAALGAALPAQRGWQIKAYPALNGADRNADVGMVVELAEIGHPPDDMTSFWTSSETLRSATTDEAQAAAISSALHHLIGPVALWIGIRLISRQLTQPGVPARWRARKKNKDELTGLQLQLAGQLSLYAARDKEFIRGFAEQAISDLNNAADRLQRYFRPHHALGQVYEQRGWAYRQATQTPRAVSEFTTSIQCYDKATRLLSEDSMPSPALYAVLDRIAVRRAKCRILTGDRAQLRTAITELSGMLGEMASEAMDLYNSACLFAVAIASPELPDKYRDRFGAQAWISLGCALLVSPDGAWKRAQDDIELTSMEPGLRQKFWDELRERHPGGEPLSAQQALPLARAAGEAIGVVKD